MNKKMFHMLLFLLLSFTLLIGKVSAEHTTSGWAEKNPPVGYDNLSDEDKDKAQELLGQLDTIWAEFGEKVVQEAEKNVSSYCSPKDDYCSDNLEDELKKASEKYEKTYFGSISKYDDGTFGKVAGNLYKNYGVIVHFPRSDGGMFTDLCDDDTSMKMDGDECEGPPVIGDYSLYTYDKAKKKINMTNMYMVDSQKLDGPKKSESAKSTTIAAHGLFTSQETKDYGSCNVADAKDKLSGDIDEPKIVKKADGADGAGHSKLAFSGEALADKVGQEMTKTFKNFTNDIQGNIFGTDCDGNSLSVVAQFLNISRPLNITDNQYVMKLVHVTQQIAFTMTIVIIAFFALMYTTGFQNMDPVKFGVRLFFCLLAVNYLPWLMQDVLNLNNIVVYNVSTLNFGFENGGNTTDMLMGALVAIYESFVNSGIGESLLLLILAFAMAIFAIMPMLRIIMWWYIRLLRIFLGAIVGPILVMLAALPQTASNAKTWVEQYVGQVFEQIFMALALVMIAVIVGNIGDFGATIGIGWFGRAMLVYAAIYFLAEVPSFAGSFLKNFGGGKADSYAKNFAKAGTKTAKKTAHYGGKAAAGGAAVGAGAVLGGVGLASGARAAVTGKSSNGKLMKKLMNTKMGKAGYKAGFGTGNTAMNAKRGFDSGYGGQGAGSGSKYGLAGTAGSLMGAGAGAGTRGMVRGKQAFDQKANQVAASVQNKLADAKVTAGLATSIGAATVMNSLKKDNLKKNLQKVSAKIEGKVHEKIAPTMTNMYQSSYGTKSNGDSQQVTTYTEEGFNKAANIAKNKGAKGGANGNKNGGGNKNRR